ncbi:MAG: hypothetical protein ACJ8EL_15645 [Rhizomicrobium sp.]
MQQQYFTIAPGQHCAVKHVHVANILRISYKESGAGVIPQNKDVDRRARAKGDVPDRGRRVQDIANAAAHADQNSGSLPLGISYDKRFVAQAFDRGQYSGEPAPLAFLSKKPAIEQTSLSEFP